MTKKQQDVNYLGLQIDLKRVEESLTVRLACIEAEAKAADDDTVAAVEYMLANKHRETEDIEDDFAGGTSGIDGSSRLTTKRRHHAEFILKLPGGGTSIIDAPPWLMPWRSHLVEFILRLRENGHEKYAAHLARLADVNSLKNPFTAEDEADVIKSIQEYLAAFWKEIK